MSSQPHLTFFDLHMVQLNWIVERGTFFFFHFGIIGFFKLWYY